MDDPDLQECADHGKQFVVILGLQNHNDFLKTAGQPIRLGCRRFSQGDGAIDRVEPRFLPAEPLGAGDPRATGPEVHSVGLGLFSAPG